MLRSQSDLQLLVSLSQEIHLRGEFNPGSAVSQRPLGSQIQKMKVDLVHASATVRLE